MIYSVAVDLVALVRPDDLGVHSREVVVDGIFLYVGVALEVVRWAVVTLGMWSRSYGLVDLRVRPCIVGASSRAVRSLGCCSRMRPSNL
jgi:hypothetical protein